MLPSGRARFGLGAGDRDDPRLLHVEHVVDVRQAREVPGVVQMHGREVVGAALVGGGRQRDRRRRVHLVVAGRGREVAGRPRASNLHVVVAGLQGADVERVARPADAGGDEAQRLVGIGGRGVVVVEIDVDRTGAAPRDVSQERWLVLDQAHPVDLHRAARRFVVGRGIEAQRPLGPAPRFRARDKPERREIDEVDAATRRRRDGVRHLQARRVEHGVRRPEEQHVAVGRHAQPHRRDAVLVGVDGIVDAEFSDWRGAGKCRLEQPDVGVGRHRSREYAVGEIDAGETGEGKIHAVDEPAHVGALAHVPGILQDRRRVVVGGGHRVGATRGRGHGDLRGGRGRSEANEQGTQVNNPPQELTTGG